MIKFSFDDKAKAAQSAAERMAAAMITNISAETEANIRALIAQAIREGIPPYDAARTIVGMIGLTAPQGQAAMKYRAQMIDSGLTLEKVNAKVDKYVDELLISRAENIARSEVMDALNTGQDEAWQQAQKDGLLSDGATKVVILSNGACERCINAYEGAEVPIGDEFDGGDPPLHPQCECTVSIGKP